jgi:lysophospholipase L1-like esterase
MFIQHRLLAIFCAYFWLFPQLTNGEQVCQRAAQNAKTRYARTTPALTIVAFGDSTTARCGSIRVFADVLDKRCSAGNRNVNIINAGVPGNDTRQARARFERDVLAQHPTLVTISFGINDSAVDVSKGATQPRVPLHEYEQNIKWMVDSLKCRGVCPILMTPNPIAWTDDLKSLYNKPPYRTDDKDGWNVLLRDYSKVVRSIARTRKLPLIDTYCLFQAHAAQPGKVLNDLMIDGMHPNDAGHAMIAKEIVNLLREKDLFRPTINRYRRER